MPRIFKFLYVYIVKCSDGTFYTGITNNVDLRVDQHNAGIKPDSYTFTRRPVKLMYVEHFNNYSLALEWETQLKKWGHAKKEALIKAHWDKLKKLAQCQNVTHSKYWLKKNGEDA